MFNTDDFLGHSNTYRRIGSKRPQYAQPPGLTGGQPPPPAPQPQPQSHPIFQYQQTPAESESSVFLNPVTTIPQFSSWSAPTTVLTPTTMATVSTAEVPVISSTPVANHHHNNYAGAEGNLLQPSVTENTTNQTYRPVYHHWFYKQELEGKILWKPFSMVDSLALEAAFTSSKSLSKKKKGRTFNSFDSSRFNSGNNCTN